MLKPNSTGPAPRRAAWVLLAPPPSGSTWLLWLAPGALLAAGAVWAFGMTRKRAEEPPPRAQEPPPQAVIAEGDYEKRLLAEAEDE